jgi:PAS domain S-box-containing protein
MRGALEHPPYAFRRRSERAHAPARAGPVSTVWLIELRRGRVDTNTVRVHILGRSDAARADGESAIAVGPCESPAVRSATDGQSLLEAQLALARRIPDWGSWTWDVASDTLSASERFTSLLGVEPNTALTLSDALAVMPQEDRAHVEATLARMRTDDLDSCSVEYRLIAADGSTRWLQAYCDAVRGDDGEIAQVLGITTDTTARVRATEELSEVSAFWQGTLDSLTAHVAVLDEHGEIISVNRPWCRFAAQEGGTGDYLGSNYVAVCRAAKDPLATDVADGLQAILDGSREHGEWEYPCHSLDGERRWFILRATRYAGRGPVRVVLAHEDVTQRHLAQERAAIQAALLGEIDAAVVVIDLERRVLEWSEGAERLYGWTRTEAVGREVGELMVRDAPIDLIAGELMLKGSWEGELVARRKDGSTLPTHHRTRVLRDEDGQPRALASVSVDISRSKEAARELASARDYLRAVTDSMGQALFTLDHDGRAQYLNPIAEALLGWSSEQLRGQVLHALIHHRRGNRPFHPVEECPVLAARLESTLVRVEDDIFVCADGSELPVAYTAAPFTTADGTEGCVVVFEDISERKAEAQRVAGELETLAWTKRVQDALTNDLFVLYAQPIIELRSGRAVQQELLIRMLDPESSSVIAPGKFLPAAEELGLVGAIDRWVIDRSTELAAAGARVELNVSARSISDPRMGCKIALDDFGTGFGTFTYLKQLPIDYLKIDTEFVRDLRDNAASRKVVEAVVGVAQGFGLKTVAEGVEDEESLQLLRQLGVDYAQGYYIGRPAALDPANPGAAANLLKRAPRRRTRTRAPSGA